MKSVALNKGMQVSLEYIEFDSFGYISRSGKIGSYGGVIFGLFINLHTVP